MNLWGEKLSFHFTRAAAGSVVAAFVSVLFFGICFMAPGIGSSHADTAMYCDSSMKLSAPDCLGGTGIHRIPLSAFSFSLPQSWDETLQAFVAAGFASAAAVAFAWFGGQNAPCIRRRTLEPPRLHYYPSRLFSRGILHGKIYA